MDEINYEAQRTNELLPKGHLPIAGSSDLFTISLSPKSFGAVYWWNHDTEELDDDGNFLASAAYLLASSFEEFLTRIACLFDEDKQANEEPSSNTNSSKSTLRELLRTIQKEHSPQTVKEIKRLIKEAGDLSQIEDRKWPFINLGNAEVLQCLLNAGLRPEILDTEGQSLLWQCSSSPECIEMLGRCGVDFNRRCGSNGETPLMRSIYLKQPEAIKQLVKLGANPTLRLDKHLAADLKRDPKLYKLVEKAKVDWQKRMANAGPASKPTVGKLTLSAAKGPKPSLKKLLQLLKHDRILENEFIEGLPEMIVAVGDISGIQNGQWPAIDKFKDPQLLANLLSASLDPNITDKKGNAILHQCAPHPDCLALLLKAGADANRANSKGETALMRAAYVGDVDCVQVLLDGGANPTIECTSFARVMMEFNDEMTAFVEMARKKWNARKHKNDKVGRQQ